MTKSKIAPDKLKSRLLVQSRGRREAHAGECAVERAVGSGDVRAAAGKITLRSVEKLKVAGHRPRKTVPAQLSRVVASIKRFGVVAPVLIDGGGKIINGHIVVEAAKALGISMVPVLEVTHLSDNEVRALGIALNRLGETGEWDLPALAFELTELQASGFALQDTGFTLPELDIILLGDGSEAAGRAANELPSPSDVVVSQLGDLWQLGSHRLICGDATRIENYETLLDGEKVAGFFIDGPYNVPIAGFVSGLGKVKHDDFVQGVGEWTNEEFVDFQRRYLVCCREVALPGAAIYSCMDWRSAHLLRQAADAAELTHINTCVWSKGSGGMGSLYRSSHELVLVFCHGKTVATNNVALGRHGRDRCNVWNYPGANRRGSSAAKALKLHATPKPVALVEDALCDVTSRGDVVLDPFSGSGTTLIAAHTTGRIGRAIELDPKFVDVAIRRFEELTGIEAIHAETGRSFSELIRLRAQ